MMVRAGDVSALLLRLDDELQAISQAKRPDSSASFASRFSAAINHASSDSVAEVGSGLSQGNSMSELPTISEHSALVEGNQTRIVPAPSAYDGPDSPDLIEGGESALHEGKRKEAQSRPPSQQENTPQHAISMDAGQGSRVITLPKPADMSAKLGSKATKASDKKDSSRKVTGNNSDGVNVDLGQAVQTPAAPATQGSIPNVDVAPPSAPARIEVSTEAGKISARAAGAVAPRLKRVQTAGAAKSGDLLSSASDSKQSVNQDAGLRSLAEEKTESVAPEMLRKPPSSAPMSDATMFVPQHVISESRVAVGHMDKGAAEMPGSLPTDAGALSSTFHGIHLSTTSERPMVVSPTSLEVGVVNGTHGWVKVRTELAENGEVKASLASSTASGERMLHRELPGLASFLHQEKVAVSSIVVQEVMGGGGLSSGSADHGGARHFQQQATDDSRSDPGAYLADSPAAETSQGDDLGDLAVRYADSSAGGWLSIRA